MVTKTTSFIRGRVARFTRVDACGRVVYGGASSITTKGIISVAYSGVIDEGTEISVPDMSGDICIYDPAKPIHKGFTLEITFCKVDPELYAMATGQRTLPDAFGNIVGFSVDTSVSVSDFAFALELWAGAQSGNACAEGAVGEFGYFVSPFIQAGTIGDFTLENAEVTFTITGAATKSGNAWGAGPYKVELTAASLPGPLATPFLTTEHLQVKIVGVAPPTPASGARPLLDPSGVTLTSVTVVPGTTATTSTFTAVATGTDPWYVEFGDGTVGYSANGSMISHKYAVPGSYTWKAYRGSSSQTGTVVVPT